MEKLSFRETFHIIRRAFGFLGDQRGRYLAGWVLAAGDIAMAFAVPFVLERLVSFVTGERSEEVLGEILLLLAVFTACAPLICAGEYLRRTSTYSGVVNLQKQLFAQIGKMPGEAFFRYREGDYLGRLNTDASRVVGIFSSYSITGFAKFLFYITAGTGMLWSIHWKLAAAAFVLCALSVWCSVLLNPKIRGRESEARRQSDGSVTHLLETLSGIQVVKVFGLQNILLERYQKTCKEIYRQRVSYGFWIGCGYALLELLKGVIQISCFSLVLLLVMEREVELSAIVLAASLAEIIAKAAQESNSFIQYIQPGLVSGRRVFELLDYGTGDEKKINEQQRAQDIPAEREEEAAAVDQEIPELELVGVCYAYPGGEFGLTGVNLRVGRGERIAIIGESGSGKSTLCRLFLGMLSPQAGKIYYRGKPVSETEGVCIRDHVSYVPQDYALFDGSVMENIRLGRKEASDRDVYAAAKRAQIHDEILNMENGYGTNVGETGGQLSGGQRQRIAIARAFLKNGSVFLFDEMSSALDPEAVERLHQVIFQSGGNETVILITHQREAAALADRVYRMERGVLTEDR